MTTALVEAVQRGGHVILMRYGAVQMVKEPSPLDLADCAAQHRLTDKGRDQGRTIGAAFRTLNIPVGQVLNSGYCRTIEYARLAFGKAEASELLLHPKYVPVPGAPIPPPYEKRVEAVKKLLATPPAAGTNTVVITHGLVVRDVAGFEMAAAEAAIFQPDGRGGTTVVVRVLPDGWVAKKYSYSVPSSSESASLPRPGLTTGWSPTLAKLARLNRSVRWRGTCGGSHED